MRETKMTKAQAEKEAKRRWGLLAFVFSFRSAGHSEPNRVYCYRVCSREGEIKGTGRSYRAAFADADSVSPSGATHE